MNANAATYFVDRHLDTPIANKKAFIEFSELERNISYKELSKKSSKVISFLKKHDIHQEDRVAMLMLDVLEFPVIFWGSLKSSVIPIPINTLLSSEVIETILIDSRAKAIFISTELLDTVRDILKNNKYLKKIFVVGLPSDDYINFNSQIEDCKELPTVDVSNNEVAFWLYSSGSTGRPKGVKHVHGSLQKTYETYAKQVLDIKENDIVFSVAKLFFAYGLGNAMTFPLAVGATSVILPTRPTPDKIIEILENYKITILFAVPTLFSALIEYFDGKWDKSKFKLRVSVSAGEALPKLIGDTWNKLTSTEILDGIGSTEMLHIFLSNYPNQVEYGTTGKAVPGYELKLVDENNIEVKEDVIGELLVKGDTSAEGYWNLREKTRHTFQGEWTRTGDKYIKQKNGNFVYCGRTDDMFKVSGIWVSPFEVEQAVSSHDMVLESAVVPEEDKEGLIKSKAFVILKENNTSELELDKLKNEIKETVKDKIGLWKYPRTIIFVKELPKTATGKIQRFKLR